MSGIVNNGFVYLSSGCEMETPGMHNSIFYRLSVRGFAYILSFRPHTSVYYTDEEAGPQQVK